MSSRSKINFDTSMGYIFVPIAMKNSVAKRFPKLNIQHGESSMIAACSFGVLFSNI